MLKKVNPKRIERWIMKPETQTISKTMETRHHCEEMIASLSCSEQVDVVKNLILRLPYLDKVQISEFLEPLLKIDFISVLPGKNFSFLVLIAKSCSDSDTRHCIEVCQPTIVEKLKFLLIFVRFLYLCSKRIWSHRREDIFLPRFQIYFRIRISMQRLEVNN